MIKGIIFDLDGTLLNTIDDLNNSINDTFKYYGLKKRNTTKETMSQVGHGMKNFIEKCFPGKDEEYILKALNVFLDAYSKQYTKCTKPYEGISELIDFLIQNGYKVGVNSNKNHEYTKHLIEMHFPNIDINFVTGIKEGDKIKPDPSNVNKVIKKMGLNNKEVLYVGDSPTDLKTAANANLKFIAVSWGYRSKEILINNGAQIIIDEPKQIIEYISQK